MRSFAASLLTVLLLASGAAGAAEPQRIISAGGDITEIIYQLGAGDRVIAVDSTSTFPAEAAGKEQIGYIRRLAAEGILSLQPDLLIAAHDAGPPPAVEQLKSAGLRVELAPKGDSLAGVQQKIRFVGDVLAMPEAAGTLAEQLETDMQGASEVARAVPENTRVIFVLNTRDGAPLVAGAGTAADAIIGLSGGVNAVTGFEGYKPMSQEAIISAAPDVLLMMSQTLDRIGGIDALLARPEFSLTPAGKNRRFVAMDGILMLTFGPRLPEAVRELATALTKTEQSD
ncbi:heme/hemin ABC transporter substrate-binding protein [Nisaea nitritireducens]|uniref:heme/hemin ABC transporter substrate-binding protein n=1 Tax=Nisaea nitritireducens TaxID=568392 RepID=UPI0018663D91|nr:ABC transporter substrate-binding protein [Nisaea nitritireducens]